MKETYIEKKRREQKEFEAKINNRLMIAFWLNIIALMIVGISILITVL